MTCEEFLTTKFGLWIDTRSSTDDTPHGSGRAVEKSDMLLQIEKSAEPSNDDLEDVAAYLAVTNHSGILTLEK